MANKTTQYTNEQFQQLINESCSYRDLVFKLGYKSNTGTLTALIKREIQERGLKLNFKASHRKTRTVENVFIENSTASQATLRRWYEKEDIEYKCSICGQEPFWQEKPLSLTLDHINGENKDNRLENLRWVCPNCDRQLDTFGSKNKKTVSPKKAKKYFCIECGAKVINENTRCTVCAHKLLRKVERPDRDTLKDLVRNKPFTHIGQEYGVSDNAVRKWCKTEGLPSKKIDIKSYSDEEWNLL